MKYLYVRLTDTDIITFKSMAVEDFDGLYKITFNGTLGTFMIVESKYDCEEVANLVEEYLASDDADKRILNLMEYNLWNFELEEEE